MTIQRAVCLLAFSHLITLIGCNAPPKTNEASDPQTELIEKRRAFLTELANLKNASLEMNQTTYNLATIAYQNLLNQNDKFILTNYRVLDVSKDESSNIIILIQKGSVNKLLVELTCSEDLLSKMFPDVNSIRKSRRTFNNILIVEFGLIEGAITSRVEADGDITGSSRSIGVKGYGKIVEVIETTP